MLFNINIIFDQDEIEMRISYLLENKKKAYICAVNANIIVEANNNKKYKKIVNEAVFNICDGSIIALLQRIIYGDHVSSYPGPDFFINMIKKKEFKSFFLGSTNNILSTLKNKLMIIDPKIQDMTFYSPPFSSVKSFDYKSIAEKINISDADIIWVSLGAPKQEEFMFHLKPFLSKGVMVGVGAAFSFYGDEEQKRAPKLIRKLYLEWLYRLVKEPKKTLYRLKREFYFLPILIYKEIIKAKGLK